MNYNNKSPTIRVLLYYAVTKFSPYISSQLFAVCDFCAIIQSSHSRFTLYPKNLWRKWYFIRNSTLRTYTYADAIRIVIVRIFSISAIYTYAGYTGIRNFYGQKFNGERALLGDGKKAIIRINFDEGGKKSYQNEIISSNRRVSRVHLANVCRNIIRSPDVYSRNTRKCSIRNLCVFYLFFFPFFHSPSYICIHEMVNDDKTWGSIS